MRTVYIVDYHSSTAPLWKAIRAVQGGTAATVVQLADVGKPSTVGRTVHRGEGEAMDAARQYGAEAVVCGGDPAYVAVTWATVTEECDGWDRDVATVDAPIGIEENGWEIIAVS